MGEVIDFFRKLTDTADWPPRWHCGQWTAFHGWLYILSDLLIWLAYFTIPVVIIRYISRKQHARFVRLYFLFAAFILSCGATHFLDALTFWIPMYRLNALARFITAVVSWVTVFTLIRSLPKAFAIRTEKEWEQEIAVRDINESRVRQQNLSLEQQVEKGTKELYQYKYALDESAIVAITDREGRIIHANDNFCAISQYSREELIGKNHRIIRSGLHTEEEMQGLWQTILNGKIWKGDLCNRAKDGSLYWVETCIIPFFNEAGEPYQFLSIRKDITERKKAEEALNRKNEELNALTAYLRMVREEERKNMARDVHDHLGQLASALQINIDWLAMKIAEPDERMQFRLDHSKKTITLLITTIRKIATSLRPSVLDDFGLNESLKWQCREFENLTGIPCLFSTNLDDTGLLPQSKTEIFRMVQESMTNITRYAQATETSVTVTDKGNEIQIAVTDNGIGFDTNVTKKTLGLLGLRERALSLQGIMNIRSEPGKGTRVSIVLPKSRQYENPAG
ncbi:MAG TPA: PAS domain S-box protein [Sediminibacterium sp.]|nr:PAS domain S-box protein [Sediminibacterium sp.]